MPSDMIKNYWHTYLATLAPDSPMRNKTYKAEPFGDSTELADTLGTLIINGLKSATCSALWEWEAEGDSLPKVGDITILLNGKNEPLCILETTEIKIQPYNQVDAQFAYEEGEGDRSLEYWRKEHWKFFRRSLAAIGKTPTLEMPLVCERFRVIYK